MSCPDTDAIELLGQARERAQLLLIELQRQQSELAAAAPQGLLVEQAAAGRQAVDSAIASVQRLLQDLAGILGANGHRGNSPADGG